MKLPLVVIDARMIESKPHGIGQYVTGLALGLKDLFSTLSESEKKYRIGFIVSQSLPKNSPLRGFPCWVAQSRFLSPMEWFELPLLLMRVKANYYHSPSFSSLPWYPIPYFQTVHDLNHLEFGNWLQKIYYTSLLRTSFRGAHTRLTVSQTVQHELARWSGLRPESIQIVPNSFQNETPPARSVELLDELGITPGNYWLSITSTKPHRNLEAFLRAYRNASAKADIPQLVLTCRPKDESGLRIMESLSEEKRQALTAHASALVFPSVYEGFGRPPIEALQLGTPVCVSDIPVHRETIRTLETSLRTSLAESITWINPHNSEGMESTLLALAKKPMKRPGTEIAQGIQTIWSCRRVAEILHQLTVSALH